jgi:hypothetical protein
MMCMYICAAIISLTGDGFGEPSGSCKGFDEGHF